VGEIGCSRGVVFGVGGMWTCYGFVMYGFGVFVLIYFGV
jgi:hypothetical protein